MQGDYSLTTFTKQILVTVSVRPQVVCPDQIAHMDYMEGPSGENWCLIGLKNGKELRIQNDIISVMDLLSKSLNPKVVEKEE